MDKKGSGRMRGRIEVGQNKWLEVEWVVGAWWQIVEAHRCTEVEVGDMMRTDLLNRGLAVYKIYRHAYSEACIPIKC